MKKWMMLSLILAGWLLPKNGKAQLWPANAGDSLTLDCNCLDSLGRNRLCDSIFFAIWQYNTAAAPTMVDSGRATTFPATVSATRVIQIAGSDLTYTLRNAEGTTAGLYRFTAIPYGGLDDGQVLKWPVTRWYNVGLIQTNYAVIDSVAKAPRTMTSVANEVRVVSAETTTTLLGNVNGNVAGSVGSVTGAVGSVTAEVRVVSAETTTTLLGNVNGNVAGNVTGSVGSVLAEVRIVSSESLRVATRVDTAFIPPPEWQEGRDTNLNMGNPDPGNMVSNPSFERTEAGVLVGWRTTTGNAARDVLAAKSGKFGMILRGNATDPGEIRSDTIRLLPGQRVVIGGKVRNDVGGLAKIFLTRAGGATVFTLASTRNNQWHELYGEFQANIADTIYFLSLSSNSNVATDTAMFDEIYVRGVGFQRVANEINLLRDPGFENKILSDAWTVTAGTGTITSQGFIPVGANRLRLGGSSSRVISDTFSIQPGHAVFFGGMCLTSDAASQNTIDLQTLAGVSQAAANPTISLNNKWVNVWQYFRNTSGAQANYRLSLQGGPLVGDTASFDHLFIFPTDTLNAIGGGGGSGCAGSGAFVCSVYVNDSNTTTGISGTNVSIWNGTTLVAGPLFTTATGKLAFQLDNGTYSIRAFNVGYRYTTNVDTVLTVSGANTKDTVYLKTISLPTAPAGGLIAITSNIYDISGDSIEGAVVSFALNQFSFFSSDDTTNLVAVAQERQATTDVNGDFTINVYPTTKLVSGDRRTPSKYQVKVVLPDGSSWITVGHDVTLSHTPGSQKFNWNLYRWKSN